MNFNELFNDDTELLRSIRKQILLDIVTGCMNDRERAEIYGLPEGCRMRKHAKIFNSERLKCGKYVWIGEGAMLDATGGLEIGDYTQIGVHTLVWSHTSHNQALNSETCKTRNSIDLLPTKIGKNCFIVGPSAIAPGVTIGDRVLISPGSFVNRDLPDDARFNNNKIIGDLERRIEDLELLIKGVDHGY